MKIFKDYEYLIQQFLEKKITLSEFQKLYFDKFKSENREMCESIFLILDGLFADLDGVTSDEDLLKNSNDFSFYIDETTLRQRAQSALRKLKKIY